MKRLTILLVFLLPKLVHAQSAVLVVSAQHSTPPNKVESRGQFIVPPIKFNAGRPSNVEHYQPDGGQLELARYGPYASANPAENLKGWGPPASIQATAATASLPSATRALLITEDYDQTISKFTVGDQLVDAHLRTEIRDIQLLGHDETASHYTQAGVVSSGAWAGGAGGTTPVADAYDLARIKSTGAYIEGVTFFYGPGTALAITRGVGNLAGQLQPNDKENFTIRRIFILRCYRGIIVGNIDGVIGDVEIAHCRDYGIYIPEQVGATVFDGTTHIYAIGYNNVNYTGIGDANPTTNPGACIWIDNDAGGNWGGPLYVETARIGLLIEGSNNTFGPVISKDCFRGNIVISGQRNTIHHAVIELFDGQTETNSAYGIDISGQDTTIDGANFRGTNGAAIPSGETAIRVTGSGASRLTLRNINFFGTDESTASIVDCSAATLNDCDIEIKGNVGEIGLDCLDGTTDRIGEGNTIRVRTTSVDTPIELKAANGVDGWRAEGDATLEANQSWKVNEQNEIYINGVRWFREGAT